MKKFLQYTGAVTWIVIIIAILIAIDDDEAGTNTKPPEKTESADLDTAPLAKPVPTPKKTVVIEDPSPKPEPKFKDFKIVKEEDISTAQRSRFKIEVEAPNADTDRKVIEALMLALVDVHRKEWPQVITGFFYSSSNRDKLAKNRLTYAPDGCAWTGEDCDGELWSDLMHGVLSGDIRHWGKPTEEEIEAGKNIACRRDLQCWGDRHAVSATLACEPLIERMAKYTYEWTDGWLD